MDKREKISSYLDSLNLCKVFSGDIDRLQYRADRLLACAMRAPHGKKMKFCKRADFYLDQRDKAIEASR